MSHLEPIPATKVLPMSANCSIIFSNLDLFLNIVRGLEGVMHDDPGADPGSWKAKDSIYIYIGAGECNIKTM